MSDQRGAHETIYAGLMKKAGKLATAEQKNAANAIKGGNTSGRGREKIAGVKAIDTGNLPPTPPTAVEAVQAISAVSAKSGTGVASGCPLAARGRASGGP